MTKVKQLAGDTLIYGGGFILSRLLHYVVFTFYLTQFFDRYEFGAYKDLYAYIAILLVLGVFRMDTALFRFGREKKDLASQFSYTFTLVLILAGFFCSAAFLFSNQIANLLKLSDLGIYVRFMAVISFLDALAFIPFAQLRLERKAKRFTIIKLINVLITISLVIAFIAPQVQIFPLENRVLYILIANLIASSVVLILLLPPISKWKPRLPISELKKLIKYSFPLTMVGLFGVINTVAPVPIVKFFYNDLGEAGSYGAAMAVAQIMVLFVTGFNYAAEPFFFKEALDKNAKKVYKNIALAFTAAGGFFMMCVVIALPLIKILLGKDFHSDLYLIPILLVANLILGVYYNFSVWYKITDKTKYGAYIAFSGMVVLLSINIILLPVYGKVATAMGSLFCFLVMTTLCYFWGQKFYRVEYNIARIVGIVILSGIGAAALSLSYANFSLNIAIPLNFLILLIISSFLYYLNRNDIRLMLQKEKSSSDSD